MHHPKTSSARALFLGLLCTFTTAASAQLVLEHTYAGGSMINPHSNQFFLLELEASGWKYVRVDRVAMEVALYHMDHSFWKSVPFTNVTAVNPVPGGWDILYISEHLFDQDDGLEFMFTTYNPISTPNAVTEVVDEEHGGPTFSVPYQIPAVRSNFHQQQYPIRNTPQGTKLILTSSAPGNDSAYVYGLAGELTTQIASTWDHEATLGTPELFPNPASGELTVRLSGGDAGIMLEMIATDGQVVRRETLTSPTTTLDVGRLTAGLYMCRFSSDGQLRRTVPFMKY